MRLHGCSLTFLGDEVSWKTSRSSPLAIFLSPLLLGSLSLTHMRCVSREKVSLSMISFAQFTELKLVENTKMGMT